MLWPLTGVEQYETLHAASLTVYRGSLSSPSNRIFTKSVRFEKKIPSDVNGAFLVEEKTVAISDCLRIANTVRQFICRGRDEFQDVWTPVVGLMRQSWACLWRLCKIKRVREGKKGNWPRELMERAHALAQRIAGRLTFHSLGFAWWPGFSHLLSP